MNQFAQQTVEQRLAKLERRCRIQARLIISFGLLIIVGGLVGFAAPWNNQVISAKRFQLVDDKGRVRSRLEMTDAGTFLAFFDEKGIHRVQFGIERGNPMLSFGDGSGKPRMVVKSLPDVSFVKLFDAKQRVQWQSPLFGDLQSRNANSVKLKPGVSEKNRNAAQKLALLETKTELPRTHATVKAFQTRIDQIRKSYPQTNEEQVAALIFQIQRTLKSTFNKSVPLIKIADLLLATFPRTETRKQGNYRIEDVEAALAGIIGGGDYGDKLDQAAVDCRGVLEELIKISNSN